jgi:hypothetical protein
MVKNKEFEYCRRVVETKMSGVEIFKMFESVQSDMQSDLSDMHFYGIWSRIIAF